MNEKSYPTSARAAIPPVPGPLPHIDMTGMHTVRPDKTAHGRVGHPRANEPGADVRRALHNINLAAVFASARRSPAVDPTVMYRSLRAGATGRIISEGGKMGPIFDPASLPTPPEVRDIKY